MPTLRKEIIRYLCIITLIMIFSVLAVSVVLQIYNDRKKAEIDSLEVFGQIKQIIMENEAEIKEIKDEYTRTCLHNATAVSRLIQADPSVVNNVDKLKEIAEFTEVDEIHIFDKSGTIVHGTHPEYYHYNFDSGEQMRFFKPMLEDKSLMLVQDITPNTAEAKLMQYSAVWSENGEFIVQIGMEPVNVMKATEKNELSYIFSLLRANTNVKLYAVNSDNGIIVGSTSPEDNGKTLSDIGIDFNRAISDSEGFNAEVNGEQSYCIFTMIDSNLIGRVIPNDYLFIDLVPNMLGLTAGLIVVAAILVTAVAGYMNKYVIGGIYDVNRKLRSISSGNLDEIVAIHNSREFCELSSHINEMVQTLLGNTAKLSYVLNKTNLRIGVYEYNENMHGVRYTEYLPQVLNFKSSEDLKLFSNYKDFQKYLNKLRRNPISDMEGVYCADTEGTRFVKLDEVCSGKDILGIVIDVTEEVYARRKIEEERDVDLLTGLLNRRGLENKLKEMFADPKKLGCSALIMVDADGLKKINDEYGHEMGDVYLQKVSETIAIPFAGGSCITSRQGGDEYVVFLYNYSSEQEILSGIERLKYLQDNSTAQLTPDLLVPLRFSFGYIITGKETDYLELMKTADERMYENKRERKKTAPSGYIR